MASRWSPAAGLAALLLLGAVLCPASARAQGNPNVATLALSGGISIPSNTAIDSTHYNAGWVCATGSIGYTVSASSGVLRPVTLAIAATGPIIGGTGSKLAGWEWSTANACSLVSAGTGWTALSTTNTTVASSSIKKNGSYAGTIYFRLRLNWASDPGGTTFTLPSLVFNLSQ